MLVKHCASDWCIRSYPHAAFFSIRKNCWLCYLQSANQLRNGLTAPATTCYALASLQVASSLPLARIALPADKRELLHLLMEEYWLRQAQKTQRLHAFLALSLQAGAP